MKDAVDLLNQRIAELEAENERLSVVKDEAERIMAEAHLAGDQYAYDLMRTVLREDK